jgi:UDPglucose 6-dehydrogenase
MFDLVNPDVVLIGESETSSQAGKMLEDFYIQFCDNTPKIHRISIESAEITKIAINCFLTTKIAFAYDILIFEITL